MARRSSSMKLAPALDINATSKYWFKGDKYIQNLAKEATIGIRQAADVYRTALKKTLADRVGSIPISSTLRIRYWHSPPGQPPLSQTFNLHNSIKSSYVLHWEIGNAWLGAARELKLHGRVSVGSDVRYAKILEFGGRLTIRDSSRKYTHWRLVNPIKTNPTIAPRPLWRPTFNKYKEGMLHMIVGHLKNARAT